MVVMYTDGACSGNPGPGGWGVYLEYKGFTKTLSGAQEDTTNNQMELKAAIEGLKALKRHSNVTIITDSHYVKNGITIWVINWKKKKWMTSNKKPVKNMELWKELDELVNKHNVTWKWVKGHSGELGNEIADSLARGEVDKLLLDSK